MKHRVWQARLYATGIGILIASGVRVNAGDTTYVARPDTFVSGGELVLYGRRVPTDVHGGRQGYWIVRGDTSVTVNGVIAVSWSMPLYPPRSRERPETKLVGRMLRAAEDSIRQSRESHHGKLVIDGKQYQAGDTLRIVVQPEGKVVTVILYDHEMHLTYNGNGETVPLERPPGNGPPPDEMRRRRLGAEYDRLVSELGSSRLLIRGHGAIMSFPLTERRRVWDAIGELRARAERDHTHGPGTVYKPLTINGIFFDPATIKDFMDN